MPPEQASPGQTLTTAADIYSLGAILYELLLGSPPPRQRAGDLETVLQVMDQRTHEVGKAQARSTYRSRIGTNLHAVRRARARRPLCFADDVASDLKHWLAGRPPDQRASSFDKAPVRTMDAAEIGGIVYAVLLTLAAMCLAVPILQSAWLAGWR